MEARSGEDPPHAGVGLDHLRRLAGSGDEHRARLLGRRKRPVRVPRHLPRARRAEAPDRVLDQGAHRAPDRGAQLRRPAPLVRADGHHALLADDRHLDRALLARRPAAEPATGTPPSVHIPASRTSSTGWRRRWAADEGALPFEVINRTASAHFTGGIPIGDSSETGAVDPYQRLFGQPGLHVIDGSVMPANTGVNPSLMITALAERAMSLWPNKGDADTRPPLGSGYERVDPVMPHRPVVPAGAPASCDSTRRRPTSSPTTRTEPANEEETMTELAERRVPHGRAGRRDPQRLRRSVLPGRPQATDLDRACRRPPLRVRRPLHLRRAGVPALRWPAHRDDDHVPVPRLPVRHHHRRRDQRPGDRSR